MKEKILIRYGEIALKGKNRRFFEEKLHRNLKDAVGSLPVKINRQHGRFLAVTRSGTVAETLRRLSNVFGVVSVSHVTPALLDIDAIMKSAEKMVQSIPENLDTFKVETRRSNKNFPLKSPEISATVGARLLETNPYLKVDVHNPKFQLFIEVGQEEAYLYHDSCPGPGGLPVGVTGKGLLLLSGGIDSPVAGWMTMKRGLFLDCLHFHTPPYTSLRSKEKAVDLCRKMAAYSSPIPLHLVSLTDIQRDIKMECPEELSITILRRMMFRIAEKICAAEKLQALVTGESLGQVASQTLESMQVISSVMTRLILRPLLGLDKQEIINMALEIGTYDISIRPYEDCCSLFVPRRPAIKPEAENVAKAEKMLDVEKLIEDALENREAIIIKR